MGARSYKPNFPSSSCESVRDTGKGKLRHIPLQQQHIVKDRSIFYLSNEQTHSSPAHMISRNNIEREAVRLRELPLLVARILWFKDTLTCAPPHEISRHFPHHRPVCSAPRFLVVGRTINAGLKFLLQRFLHCTTKLVS